MRYIIKRIIIGVGIAIALMLITKTFSLSAYATNTTVINPNQLTMTYVQNNTKTTTNYTPTSFTPDMFNGITFYGKTSTGNGIEIRQLLFRHDISSLDKGYYDINFFFYNSTMLSIVENQYSFGLYSGGRYWACNTTDPSDLNNGQANTSSVSTFKNMIGVSCRNIYVDNSVASNLNIAIWFTSTDNYAGSFGISPTNFQLNGSSAIENNQQTIIEQQQEQTDAINDVNDTLNDDDTSDAQSSGSSFFNNFSSTDHGGLSGIVTVPLEFIQSLASQNSCEPISIPLPFVNNNASLPCLSSIVNSMPRGAGFLAVYHAITTGLISYWVLVKLFSHVRSFKKPDEDRVEVLEL